MGALFDSVVAAAKENFWLAGDEPMDHDLDGRPVYPCPYSERVAARTTIRALDRETRLSLLGELLDEYPALDDEFEEESFVAMIEDLLVSLVASELRQDPEITQKVEDRDAIADARPRALPAT